MNFKDIIESFNYDIPYYLFMDVMDGLEDMLEINESLYEVLCESIFSAWENDEAINKSVLTLDYSDNAEALCYLGINGASIDSDSFLDGLSGEVNEENVAKLSKDISYAWEIITDTYEKTLQSLNLASN